ncbi:hypothetical protein Lalb_Chr08g0237841 [Lupinus albus]|uniref:Uncharacterized protein n=1 Tax=Lupinus albus TaxID=3870 RepID=A0A6A4Q466_LUPAL|nr:hypothetical protein Lalb_Chr08g0237841 [Lupinus albus]
MGGGSIWKIEFLVWLSQVIGGLCSKSSQDEENVVVMDAHKNWQHGFIIAPQRMERNVQMQEDSDEDDLYDGIPRFTDSFLHKSRSIKSSQVAIAKSCFTIHGGNTCMSSKVVDECPHLVELRLGCYI